MCFSSRHGWEKRARTTVPPPLFPLLVSCHAMPCQTLNGHVRSFILSLSFFFCLLFPFFLGGGRGLQRWKTVASRSRGERVNLYEEILFWSKHNNNNPYFRMCTKVLLPTTTTTTTIDQTLNHKTRPKPLLTRFTVAFRLIVHVYGIRVI